MTDDVEKKLSEVQTRMIQLKELIKTTVDQTERSVMASELASLRSRACYLRKRSSQGPDAYRAYKRQSYRRNAVNRIQTQIDELHSIMDKVPKTKLMETLLKRLHKKLEIQYAKQDNPAGPTSQAPKPLD